MSSATSIDRVNRKPSPDADARTHASGPPRDQLRPWHFFVLASLLAATAAVVMARQARPEHLVLISVMIGAAGLAAAALYRTLVPLVGADAAVRGAEPLSETRRAVLEREKMLALRSIKELEFDRAMGKLSAKDFEEMAGRLRSRAISLIRQLDQGETGYRELIERELSARLATQAPRPRRAAGAPATAPSLPDANRICACATVNDPDATFCKRCGAKLTAGDGAA
jgi:hypothetical protein